VSEAVCAVTDLGRIDRASARAESEAHFSAKVVIDAMKGLLVEAVSVRGA
jgi:hypothetical protein